MAELLIIVPVIWALVMTWAVGNLYFRPAGGLPEDELEVLREFVDRLRKLAASESHKGRRR